MSERMNFATHQLGTRGWLLGFDVLNSDNARSKMPLKSHHRI
jgi:hypothetical protein